MSGEEINLAATGSTPTIWQALDGWSRTLAPWQQFIVGIATNQGKLSPAQVDAAYKHFLIGRGLRAPAEEAPRSQEPPHGRPTEVLAEQLILTRLDSLAGVNALLGGTALTFGPALTVIYGPNGAGKSGFARVFANACFSRQRPEIVPDINGPDDQPAATARFHFSIGDAEQVPVVFGDGSTHLPLKRVTVFDTAVARHHITQAAAFEFKPAGFDVFPEIARVYGLLSEKLDRDIAAKIRPNEFPAAFLGGGTEVHAAVTSLGAATDLDPLRLLAQYGPGESARIAELDEQILALRSQSPKEALVGLKEAKTDLQILKVQLGEARLKFESDAVSKRSQMIKVASETAATASALGSDQFKRPFFNAVGTTEWETFITSARALAHKEGHAYPADNDRCLLCERPLDEGSKAQVDALFAFVEGDARQAASAAQKIVSTEANALRALNLTSFSETARVRSHVHRLAPEVEAGLVSAFSTLSAARDSGLAHLEKLTDGEVASNVAPASLAMDALSERIGTDIVRLEADNTEASLVSLDAERRVLRHRHVLSQQFPAIEAFVRDAVWAAKALAAKSSLGTRPITDKEKELFARIVGGDYRARFAAECELLDCNVPVELQTVGRSGQTMRSLAMKGGHRPDTILSEGEQRAVALADFLTEVSLNPASAGVILDDPVTSQDHYRRQRIAHRLVVEATARQVIVFTHDLVFLNGLFEAAAEASVAIEAHWVDRDAQGRPGKVSLGDAPATIRIHDTTARAEQALVDAQALAGTARDDAIRRGMGSLRRTLEETVVRKVFKDAVPRWSDQVRVTTLRQINWNNAKIEEICSLYETLSRYIEGHSHTDEASGAPPQPADLEARIAEVKVLIKWAKAHRSSDSG